MEFNTSVARRTRSRTVLGGCKTDKNRSFTANSSKLMAKKRKGSAFAEKTGKRPASFRENSSTACESVDGGNAVVISVRSDDDDDEPPIKEVSKDFTSERESDDEEAEVVQSSGAEPEEEAEVEESSTESVSEEEEETDSEEELEEDSNKTEVSETVIEISSGEEDPRVPATRIYHSAVANRTRSKTSKKHKETIGPQLSKKQKEEGTKQKSTRQWRRKGKPKTANNKRFYEFLTSLMLEEDDDDELENLITLEKVELLPRKFNWRKEEEDPAKNEEEEQMDALWAEMELGLRIGKVGSSYHVPQQQFHDKEEDEEEVVVVEDGYCPKGKHQMALNEEIGLICSICSYVETEIRHVYPTMPMEKVTLPSKSYFREDSYRSRFSLGDLEDHGSEDDLKYLREQCPLNGTVWDLVPTNISSKLFPHQKEGFEFMWNNLGGSTDLEELRSSGPRHGGGGCILSHAPGTGKTRLTLVFLKAYLELFPRSRPIVIAPATMLLTWEEEFEKCNIDVPFHNLNNNEFSMKERHKVLKLIDENRRLKKTVELTRMVKLHSWKKSKSVLGISYDLFKTLVNNDDMRKILLEMPGVVVLDEGHIPRNDNSGIWNILLMLKTKKRIILSGTPFQNNCKELHNTLKLVRPEVAKCVVPKKASILKEAMAPHAHVYNGSILQRDLRGLSSRVLVLNPTGYQAKILQAIESCNTSVSTLEFEHKQALVTVHPSLVLESKLSEKEKHVIRLEEERLRVCRNDPREGAKTRFLVEFIRLSTGLNEKVLVFSQLKKPLKLITEHLSSTFNWTEGEEVVTMNGDLEQKQRQNLIGQFNDPYGKARVLLASIKACSEGISLVGASRVILLDVVWNPSVERQAISRAYRLGQKKFVYTYHLMMKGSSEGNRYTKQTQKQRLSEFMFPTNGGGEESSDPGGPSTTPLKDQVLDAMTSHPELKGLFPVDMETEGGRLI